MKQLSLILAFLFTTATAFGMHPQLENCLTQKENPDDSVNMPDRPYSPMQRRGLGEVLEQVARQKLEEKITEKVLTEMLEQTGVEGAADLAGDLIRVYALTKNIQSIGDAKTDVQRYEAVYSTVSTAVGFWFPIISLAMQLGLMQDRLIGGWSVADDYRYIEELRLRSIQIQTEMVEAKKKEMKASARALQVLQCETELSQERTQRLAMLYRAAHCESRTASSTTERTLEQTGFCIVTGHSILREAKLSFSLQSRIWADPLTIFLMNHLPDEKDRAALKTAIREHFAKEVQFANSVRSSQKAIGELREALIEHGDGNIAKSKALNDQKNFCRQMVRSKTATVAEAYKQRSSEPEIWDLVKTEFSRFLEEDCPEIKTEKLSLLGLKMIEN